MSRIGDFTEKEVQQLIQKLEPIIYYSLFQTKPELRDELKQHLYESSLNTLKKVKFNKLNSLFIYSEEDNIKR
ncbi:TPA: hypothetical protein NJY08_004850 [Salmonella enterica subsp. enterica serovar Typhi str. AG3]|nr:hypothetical protein [Salmonella enterica subsp. enterica serovar Typhi str. AG3]